MKNALISLFFKQVRKLFFQFSLILLSALAITGIGLTAITIISCEKDEECLSWGENCSQKYKQDNYGTTDIDCCDGQCADHGSGIVTCRE